MVGTNSVLNRTSPTKKQNSMSNSVLSIIEYFTRHKVAANLAMIMMVLSGVWAISRINTSLDPAIEWPVVFVNVDWRGASAEDVEQLIVVPIESQLRGLQKLEEVYSASYTSGAFIRIQFNHGADMTVALDSVKDRVAQIRNLPVDMEPLRIRRSTDFEDIAALIITTPGELVELAPLVRDMEHQLVEVGVDRLEFDGLPEEEIAIQVSSEQLIELNTSLDNLADEVRLRSSNSPAGIVGRGQGSRQLRSLEQRRDASGFSDLEISVRNDGNLVQLGDIAIIEKRAKAGQSTLLKNGQVAVEVSLYRLTDSDAFDSANAVHAWLDEVRSDLPEGMTIHIYQEVWVLLKHQLNLILENGLTGLVLVVIILFLFLSGRVGFWVMVGIPVSFLFATLFYYAVFDGGINILALIAYVMALGIVVDDAIVVSEDAVTLFEEGKSPEEAAAGGAKRMFFPVVTSSLTTLAAFVPLLLTGGDMGAFIVTLPTVLLCVILASLVECFLVLPGHLKQSFEKMDRAKQGRVHKKFGTWFLRLRTRYYEPVLNYCLKNPAATVCTAIGCVVLAFSLAASGRVGLNLVTGMSLEMLSADIEFSAEATEADKTRYLAHLESTLEETNQEFDDANINGFVTRFNSARFNQERKRGDQYGSLTVEYAWEEQRTVAPQIFVDSWKAKVSRMPYVEQFQLAVQGGANNGQPDITIVLRGVDIPTLKLASEELKEAMSGHEGVSNIFDDLPYGRDQIVFNLTPVGKALGLTTAQLGQQLRSAYNGNRVQIFNLNDAEVEVLMMLPDEERNNLSSLKKFPIRTATGEMMALGLVANLSARRGIDVINHNDGRMSVYVSASIDSSINNTQRVLAHLEQSELKAILEKHNLTSGLGGNTKRNQQMLETFSVGAVLTLAFIYLILAWSFASYVWPLAVMIAIPLGLTGAIAGHWFMNMDIGAMSLLAFFSLTGIVVNDSIVLISFFRRNLEAGQSVVDAIHGASLSRFRAVILTSLTTIAGLTPLMFETFSLAMYMVPIAITICFGLSFATLLILLVVPALIILIEDGRRQLNHYRNLYLSKLTNSRRMPATTPATPTPTPTTPGI
jgi:multidrug efflux pump subunit AcrB